MFLHQECIPLYAHSSLTLEGRVFCDNYDKILEFTDSFGDKIKVQVYVSSYQDNGRIFVGLYSYDEDADEWVDYGDLTINLPYDPAGKAEGYIPDFASKEKIKFIRENKLGVVRNEYGYSGMSSYRKVAFNVKRLRELDPEGIEEYLEYLKTQKD